MEGYTRSKRVEWQFKFESIVSFILHLKDNESLRPRHKPQGELENVELWQDAEYIYNKSISSKHPSLDARLIRERAERKWVPQAARTDTSGHGK